MNKYDLVDAIAAESGLNKADAGRALDGFTSAVTNALKDGGSVSLVGFGTFSKVRRKARKGRNPQTGAPIKIKATNVVKFRPGKKLKNSM